MYYFASWFAPTFYFTYFSLKKYNVFSPHSYIPFFLAVFPLLLHIYTGVLFLLFIFIYLLTFTFHFIFILLFHLEIYSGFYFLGLGLLLVFVF
jgi:hypothetical protein